MFISILLFYSILFPWCVKLYSIVFYSSVLSVFLLYSFLLWWGQFYSLFCFVLLWCVVILYCVIYPNLFNWVLICYSVVYWLVFYSMFCSIPCDELSSSLFFYGVLNFVLLCLIILLNSILCSVQVFCGMLSYILFYFVVFYYILLSCVLFFCGEMNFILCSILFCSFVVCWVLF